MSSREIADLSEKRHDHVMRDIKKMLADLGMPAPKFGGTSMVQQPNGGEREAPCFHLPKDLTLTLVSGYNVVLRKRIIDRWLELEGQRSPAKLTGSQLMAAALVEANATMQAQAQLFPAFSARLVDRRQELEPEKAAGALMLPDFFDPAVAARAWTDAVAHGRDRPLSHPARADPTPARQSAPIPKAGARRRKKFAALKSVFLIPF